MVGSVVVDVASAAMYVALEMELQGDEEARGSNVDWNVWWRWTSGRWDEDRNLRQRMEQMILTPK